MSQTIPARCTLKVKNFLTLKDIECDFAGVNCIIGPQAEGKSIIAKLLSIFFNYLLNIVFQILNEEKKDGNVLIQMFSSAFQKSAWENQQFEIYFILDGNTITIDNNDKNIHIQHCSTLQNNIKEIEIIIKNRKINTAPSAFDLLYENNIDTPRCFKIIANYIADTRMVYSAFLAKNVFRAMNENQGKWTIDPFLRRYMSQYELEKNNFSQEKHGSSFDITNEPHDTDVLFKSVIKGVYRVRDNEEYIIQDNNVPLPLFRTSAGQQVALPILLMMSMVSKYLESNEFLHFMAIEEPEAHIFPTAQKAVMEYIVATYNRRAQRDIFCCTTHSPYILSTLNNCITAHEALKTDDAEKIAAMEKILSREHWIPFEDVRCYYLEGGTIKSLMDAEFRVIDGSLIDTASEALSTDLAHMLDVLG